MHKLRAALMPLCFVAAVTLGAPARPLAAVAVSVGVGIAPPALPVYAQPPIPGPGYIWNPGYWAWGTTGYYWVPGLWVLPPAVGLLWTPPYWGWGPGGFLFHAGYWGPTVGFYGGINYGFGYFGVGFGGGYWSNGNFFYNRAVTNIGNTRITNVYNRNVTVNRTSHVAFNGGPGGTTARPTPAELAAAREQHVAPTAAQVRQQEAASTNRALRASVNHGNPSVAATRQPGEFTGRGAVSPHAAAEHRVEQYRAAPHERAVQQHAARERAYQRRAAEQRAMHERRGRELGFERRAAHERAAPQHFARGRAFERHAAQHQRAAQPHAGHEPAGHRRAG
jgi:hypothetical protein